MTYLHKWGVVGLLLARTPQHNSINDIKKAGAQLIYAYFYVDGLSITALPNRSASLRLVASID